MSRENTQNKGFSVLEVVIVIAVIAILGSVSLFMLNSVPNRKVANCAENIMVQVEQTRTSAISFQNASIVILKKADGVYLKQNVTKNNTTQSTETKIGDADIKVEYKIPPSAAYTELTASNELEICFNRSTGSFENSELNGADAGQACSGIRVSKGDYAIELKLSKITGKITSH